MKNHPKNARNNTQEKSWFCLLIKLSKGLDQVAQGRDSLQSLCCPNTVQQALLEIESGSARSSTFGQSDVAHCVHQRDITIPHTCRSHASVAICIAKSTPKQVKR
eukprot:2842117-Amphidinium_carterae.1